MGRLTVIRSLTHRDPVHGTVYQTPGIPEVDTQDRGDLFWSSASTATRLGCLTLREELSRASSHAAVPVGLQAPRLPSAGLDRARARASEKNPRRRYPSGRLPPG